MESKLESIAIQACRINEMVAFYTEAFGGQFQKMDVGGLACWFGKAAGLTIKLVPFRDAVDFEGYPHHQLGFRVPDVGAVIACAIKHGGRQEEGDRFGYHGLGVPALLNRRNLPRRRLLAGAFTGS